MLTQNKPAPNAARQLAAGNYALDTRPTALDILPP
jgi:hypothetical protein